MVDEIKFSGPTKTWLQFARKALFEFDQQLTESTQKMKESLVIQSYIAEKFKR